MSSTSASIYRRTILERPALVVFMLALVLAFFAYEARHFALDASADALLLEDDEDLRVFRQTQARYRTQDLLIVTYTPNGELFTQASLDRLAKLRDELAALPSVDRAFSLLEVPLLTSADITLSQLSASVPTLQTHRGIDYGRVREEISTSAVFSELILSKDGTTTAILLSLKDDPALDKLLAQRSALRSQRLQGTLSEAQAAELARVSASYDQVRTAFDERRHQDIAAIRAILRRYADEAALHLGGVPMITDDMTTYIGNDLLTFGGGVAVFILATLTLIFRRIRWVLLPAASCVYAGLLMLGLLGLLGWKVTVISSNFVSLMLIITLSMNIHLIVRYRQLRNDHPDGAHTDLVELTTRKMVWPCLYTALTTILGFCSLVFSGIKPVIDFGWMMSIGLGVTFCTSFILFPALLVALGPLPDDGKADAPVAITAALAGFTQRRGGIVLAAGATAALLSAIGITRLEVENSFIDYFREHTEIHQGMKLIDERLGGTTPLDILLDVTEEEDEECADTSNLAQEDKEYCDDLALMKEESSPADYWFTPYKIDRIKAVHDYLESIPAVGKVLSLASILRVGEAINDNNEFTPFELAILYKKIPADIREQTVEPYISVEENEARITLRILDSMPELKRKALLDQIRRGLTETLAIPAEEVEVSGLLVLYNNMLQSLYQSQIQTVGAVLLGIAIMFMILFRSVTLALIGIIPNALAAAMVLGIMGLADIPLDMMTITIAAITIGIAVDNAIHYIYRFKEEYALQHDYGKTLETCHANIGRAVLYTSVTIIFGFSILVFSNFIPTILFGLLTAFAMFVALLAVLTLLPKLILMMRPF
ncbi:MAG: MMPL family transporter [Gammaproteobacteria bacterium]|nr:MMPL family transporter [Gammaproteobacteria bacterium]